MTCRAFVKNMHYTLLCQVRLSARQFPNDQHARCFLSLIFHKVYYSDVLELR